MNQSIKTNSLISILFMCIGMLSVKAQNSITIHPTTESVKIDGEINEADWKQHLQNQNSCKQTLSSINNHRQNNRKQGNILSSKPTIPFF